MELLSSIDDLTSIQPRQMLTPSRHDVGGIDRALASRIDHTLLRAGATRADVRRVCGEAVEYGFASVCVHPAWIPDCANALAGSGVTVCTVIAFPFGAASTSVKTAETRQAYIDGAREFDVVMNIGRFLSGDDGGTREDVAAVVHAAKDMDPAAVVKVILETPMLSGDGKARSARCAVDAGADFVKTCTGFFGGGATLEDVALLRDVVGTRARVKASGGIRTRAEALGMLRAGADRIGTSAGIAIVSYPHT